MTAPSETEIQADIRKSLGLLPDVRLWRNNSGQLIDRTGRPVRYGVAQPGGSDLLGMMRVVVTPAMVGRTLAVFIAAEVKRPDWKPRNAADRKRLQEQLDFVALVQGFGGVAGIVRSPEDALRLLRPDWSAA